MDYKDYYKILGIERGASQDEIKRADRKLVRKYHPDVNTGPDAAEAEQKFKDVGEAYEVLHDPEKRTAYDRLAADCHEGHAFRPPPEWDEGFEFFGGGYSGADPDQFGAFFDELFARRGASAQGTGPRREFSAPSQDHHAKIVIDLETAYRGGAMDFVLRKPELDWSGPVTLRERTIRVSIKSIKGCIGCGECVKSCSCDVIRMEHCHPVAGGPGSPPDAELAQVDGGPFVPQEFQRTFDTPPMGAGKGGAPGGPTPGFAPSANVGGALAGMAIHKCEGLVPMDNRCASNIPGLYAAGDALGSHVVGGTYTQIGSSLAGSAVQGALAYIEELRDHHAPMLRAANMHELQLAHETRNLILSAEMKLRASLFRTESRCSHYRLDYPEIDEENWRAWVNIYENTDASMHLEKQPFGNIIF